MYGIAPSTVSSIKTGINYDFEPRSRWWTRLHE